MQIKPVKLVGGPDGFRGKDVTQSIGNPREPGKRIVYFQSPPDQKLVAYEYSAGDGNYHFRPILTIQAEGKTDLKSYIVVG